MATYTAANAIKKITTGDESGTWGDSTNNNFDIIDRALNGVGSITLSGTSHTLTTTDGSLTDGMFKVLSLAGSPTGTNTITISPNDQDKLYFVKNASGQSAVFSQGTGANVTIPNGGADIIFADGAGSGAAVSSLFASSVIFGDNVTLNSDSSVLGFGADTDTTLTHTDGTGLTLNSTNKLTFGDAASFIQQSSNGVLRIDGEATIDLNASTAVTVSNDLKLDSDSAVLGFGADNDVTIIHDPDDGLFFKSAATGDDNPFVLTIQTGETDIAQDDKLGVINFQAPDEGAGTDAILVAAGIEAIAEGDFAADSNATSLVFKTGASAAAAEQARIDSAGRVQINATDGSEFLNVNGALGVKGASSNFSAGPARTLVDFTGSLGRVGTVNGTGTATPLTFITNNGEAMRIDTSKRVLINTTTSVGGYQLQVTNSSGSVQQLLTAAANFNSTIAFADPDSNTAGQIVYAHNGDQMRFHVNGNSTQSMTIDSSGNVTITGSISKGSGSFRISHPLPQKSETHDLVHSFIEGPKVDLIYRGKIQLQNGEATINIDEVSTMTDGTFEVLCDDVQCFTTNETGWTAVKGSVSGNILTIQAQENTCTDTISWMVIGERKDQNIISSDLTDSNGKLIVEPLKS